MNKVGALVWAETEPLLKQVIAAARSYTIFTGGEIVAVSFGDEQVKWAYDSGVDRIVGFRRSVSKIEQSVDSLEKLVEDLQPIGFVIGSTKRGRAVAARLAARLRTSAITNVDAFVLDESGKRLQLAHQILGGQATRFERCLSNTFIATVKLGSFSPAMRDTDAAEPSIDWLSCEMGSESFEIAAVSSRNDAPDDLPLAEIVVGYGLGVKKAEDLDLVEELASELNAGLGCTRNLTLGKAYMPANRHIGMSGATIKPRLYVAVGISGQPQHVSGIKGSGTIVAINVDRNAPIFNYADYFIEDDLYTIVPLLIEEIKNYRLNFTQQ